MTEEEEEQEEQEHENKRIRPRERALGQKCLINAKSWILLSTKNNPNT